MKIEKTNVMRILDQKKIEYNYYTYETEDEGIDGIAVAQKINQDPKRVYKTLVTKSIKNNYVFMLPVEDTLDLKKAAKAVGEKSIEMIAVNQINDLTGYIRGGCSPIGMKKQLPTVIDISCSYNEYIIFSAGKIGYQIEMKVKDLINLIKCKVIDILIS